MKQIKSTFLEDGTPISKRIYKKIIKWFHLTDSRNKHLKYLLTFLTLKSKNIIVIYTECSKGKTKAICHKLLSLCGGFNIFQILLSGILLLVLKCFQFSLIFVTFFLPLHPFWNSPCILLWKCFISVWLNIPVLLYFEKKLHMIERVSRRIARNYAETVSLHKICTPGN